MSDLKIDHFDALLQDNGPAAVVLHRKLKPVEGDDAWIFPPTFAQSESADEEEGSGGNYQIDPLPDDSRKNVCIIDSIGSQANRIEPIFKKAPYAALVPQIRVKMAGDDEVNILDAGHRAADAVIRFSTKYANLLSNAFRLYQQKRDAGSLLALAPTSLIFGVWDSRGTGAKIQRVVRSTIRAYNVIEAKRSATYQAAYDYVGNGVINSELDKGSGKNNPLSQEGFKYSLATKTHGGVTVRGGIQQEATINLVALRAISHKLPQRRYLLALSLVALSYTDESAFNLREGCLLCATDPANFRGNWKVVKFDGTEDSKFFSDFSHEKALEFANAVTKSTTDGVVVTQPAAADQFDQAAAEKWLATDKKKRKALSKAKQPTTATEPA